MEPHSPAPLRRTPWWLLLGLYVLSVLVLGFLARQVPGPLDVDGSYYFLVARNLTLGRGLSVDAVWHFFQPTFEWPQPAGDLWMPLSSLLMTPALLLGTTFRFAQAAQVLLAALLPLLSYRVARSEGAAIPWATLAGLITLFAGTVTVHWVDTDCYTAYALVGGAALFAMGQARHNPRWLVIGGLLGGLGAVTRNDGILLLVVLWMAALLFSRAGRQPIPWCPLLLGTTLFLLPPVLWGLRNTLVFGQPAPVPPTFFLTLGDYSQLFAYRPQADWSALWQQDWATFFSLRAAAVGASLTIMAQDLQLWGLIPWIVVTVGLRRRPALWPAFLYLLLLFVALNGAFPLLVLHGTWSRSVSAFLPIAYTCVALGTQRLVERLLHWRPALPPRLVQHTFLALGGILAVLVGWSAMSLQLQTARTHPETWRQIGDWLQQNSATDEVVMAQDPMAIVIYGERRAVGIPHEDISLLLEVARTYGVDKIVLVGRSRSLLPEALQSLYATGASQGPFVLLWQEGEIQLYDLEP